MKDLFGILDRIAEEVCNETAEYIHYEAKRQASLDEKEMEYSNYEGYDNIGEFEAYKSAFNIKRAEKWENGYRSRSYNDFRVYMKKVGDMVPYGCLIEWGTGTAGYGTPVGDYTLSPWDERTRQQALDTGGYLYGGESGYYVEGGKFGMSPQPHWTPAIEKGKEMIKTLLSRKLEEMK